MYIYIYIYIYIKQQKHINNINKIKHAQKRGELLSWVGWVPG